MSSKPPAPYGAEIDLHDFDFTPIYRGRLFGSRFHAVANDSEWRAGVTLWLKSQDQSPAGTLPTEDAELCRLAELGRDLRTWRKVKTMALHGWVEHDNGRLYHGVITTIVTCQWTRKTEQRERTKAARTARAARRLSHPLSQSAPPSVTDPSTEDVTETVASSITASKGQGQGQGQGQGESKNQNPCLPALGVSEPREAAGRQAGQAGRQANLEISEGWLAEAAESRRAAGLPPIDLVRQAAKALARWMIDPPDDPHAAWIGWAMRGRDGPTGGNGHAPDDRPPGYVTPPPGPPPKPEDIWPDMREPTH